MPSQNEFDPMEEISAEDEAYLDRQRRAMQRQSEAWANRPGQDPEDVGRAEAADAHRKATMEQAGVTPAEMSERLAQPPPPTDPEVAASMPGAQVSAPEAASAGVPATLSLYKAVPVVGKHEIPSKGEQYAPDWKALKDLIASHDGTWGIQHYELPVDVRAILGFFGKVGWDLTEEDFTGMCKASFSAIVKDDLVFRADPDE